MVGEIDLEVINSFYKGGVYVKLDFNQRTC